MIYTIDRKDLNNTFVTADQHFGHANIIRFCNRPFESVEEMDQTMIGNWNKIVGPKDTIFHLGDFTLGDWSMAYEYLKQLNGNIKFLRNPWHHDKRWLPEDDKMIMALGNNTVTFLPPMVILEIPEKYYGHPLAITLCHYPLAVWDRILYGAWMLHGHSHGNYKGEGFILDVGVDCMNFYPISLGNVLGLMYERGWIDG